MNTTPDQNTTVPSAARRIILSSAYRHEQHSAERQERATKTLRRMRRFEDNDVPDRRLRHILSTEDTLED